MLQSIRDKSQGWLAWTIVSVICITFALWGVRSYLYHNQMTDVVAKVNGIEITHQQFTSAYNQLKRQTQLQSGDHSTLDEKTLNSLKETALQAMISSVLLQQAASHEGFYAGDDLVEITLAKMPIFQEQGVFSQARFQQVIENLLYTPEQFVNELRQNIVIDQFKSGMVGTAFVLPNELKQVVQLIHQERSFSYFIIPIKSFISKVKLPNNAAQQYYQQHQDEFKLPEYVSINYLRLSVQDLMNKINPTEQQLKQFYQDNVSAYSKPKQWKLAHIFIAIPASQSEKDTQQAEDQINKISAQLKQGKSFASLAKQYSQDSQTASQGGEMSWMIASQLDPHLMQALIDLHQVGDVSEPIKTDQGYEMIKLVDTRPAKVLSFNEVQDKVKEAYKQQKAEAQFATMSDQLSNITYENPRSLDKAAKELGLTVQKTEMFTQAGGQSTLTKNPKILTAAFSDDVLLQGNNSEPINLSDEDVVILHADQHKPAVVKPFDQVKAKIINQLLQQTAQQQAQQLANNLTQSINAGKSIQNIAAQNGFQYQSVNYVSQDNKKIDNNLLGAVFQISRSGNQAVDVPLPSQGFAVILLQGVKEGQTKISTIDQNTLTKGIANDMGLMDYQLYLDHLMQKAKIIRNLKNDDDQES